MSVNYSLNEVFDELVDKDLTVELIGYIDELSAPQDIKGTKLMKFTINNGSGRRIVCLIWGEDLINKYQKDLTIFRVLHIDRACTEMSKFKKNSMTVPLDLLIQDNTSVTFLGFHVINSADIKPTVVNFESIKVATGLISIRGFIKTEFALSSNRFGTSSFGCGSITDCTFKITVIISNYSPISIPKGSFVRVIGEVKVNDGPIRIVCKDSTCISVDKSVEKKTIEELQKGIRTPKRPLSK